MCAEVHHKVEKNYKALRLLSLSIFSICIHFAKILKLYLYLIIQGVFWHASLNLFYILFPDLKLIYSFYCIRLSDTQLYEASRAEIIHLFSNILINTLGLLKLY